MKYVSITFTAVKFTASLSEVFIILKSHMLLFQVYWTYESPPRTENYGIIIHCGKLKVFYCTESSINGASLTLVLLTNQSLNDPPVSWIDPPPPNHFSLFSWSLLLRRSICACVNLCKSSAKWLSKSSFNSTMKGKVFRLGCFRYSVYVQYTYQLLSLKQQK